MRLEHLFSFPYRFSPAEAAGDTSRLTPTEPSSRRAFGLDTFNAESGPEGTRYFSRVIHWPGGGSSGVTIGAGYDMGQRSASSVVNDLTRAGVALQDALFLSQAAGVRGDAAQRFVILNRQRSPVLTEQAQANLFHDIVAPTLIADIQRILRKPDTIQAYGAISWDALPTPTQELLFDLRYRGDYTPSTRKLLHPAIVAEDPSELLRVMEDRPMWRRLGVPESRIDTRIRIAQRIVGEL